MIFLVSDVQMFPNSRAATPGGEPNSSDWDAVDIGPYATSEEAGGNTAHTFPHMLRSRLNKAHLHFLHTFC